MTRAVTRRTILAALGASIGSWRSHAAVIDLVAVGNDGWLFPIWDEVTRVDLGRITPVAEICNAAAAILNQVGVQVAFALTPTKSRVYRDLLPNDFRFSADADRRYTLALQELRRSGVLAPDLLAPLAAQRAALPGEAAFFKADTHWTAVAAQAAAAETARLIQDRLRLAPSPQPGMILSPPVDQIWERNDLAALLPSPIGSKYPSESYKVRQPAEAAGSSFIAEDKADVVVIGNSFMQPRLGFAAMLSSRLNRPVSLAWKVHQVGSYQALLAYVASIPFQQQRPKLIVWNFHESDMTIQSDRRDVWGQNAIAPQAFLSKLRQMVSVA